MLRLRRVAVPAAVLLGLALLAGCVLSEEPEPEFTGPNPGTQPTGAPAPSITAHPVGTPIDATCDQLVSPDTVYQFNPNFVGIHDFTPSPGSIASSAVAYEGVACRWQNETNGQNIDVSAAQLDDETLTSLKNAAFADSQMVPTYGDEAYFAVEGGVGTAQVFQGSFWVVAESPVFFEPGDATEFVQSVLAGLGA
jgi:hypothetical protein